MWHISMPLGGSRPQHQDRTYSDIQFIPLVGRHYSDNPNTSEQPHHRHPYSIKNVLW